jgi:hypothetical protein
MDVPYWTGKSCTSLLNPPFVLNDQLASGITPQLSMQGVVSGRPYRLISNEDLAFQGSLVLGMGFMLAPDEASDLIKRNHKNSNCLFPYLNGEDLNSQPDQKPTRWVINFHNWPLDRTASGSWKNSNEKQRKQWLRSGKVPIDFPTQVADDYPDLLSIIEEKVKPERLRLSADIAKAPWWIYWRIRSNLYAKLTGKSRVLVTARVSGANAIDIQPNNIVFHEKVVVFAGLDISYFSVLQSSLHWAWANEYSSTLGALGNLNYSLTDCFENFPLPIQSEEIQSIGERYFMCRASLMKSNNEGLTKTYNRVNNPNDLTSGIAEFRQLLVEMDQAVAAAYRWQDLKLDHDFHETKQGVRYTISESARSDLLDRLLELNHRRYISSFSPKNA